VISLASSKNCTLHGQFGGVVRFSAKPTAFSSLPALQRSSVQWNLVPGTTFVDAPRAI